MRQTFVHRPQHTRIYGPLILMATALLILGASCLAPQSAREGSRGEITLTVAAAADLQFAFEEIGRRFEQRTGARVEFSFGSSGQLATQIENGAPMDVFASADAQYIDRLQIKGFIIPETRQLYALGRIVLTTNRRSGLHPTDLRDLLHPQIKNVAIAHPEHAPYGLAARQALEKAGIWEQIKPKLVYGENVRQALQFVQTGNAEAGIIALAIAGVPEVSYTVIDPSLYQPLPQTMAVVKGTKRMEMARQFVSFVNGPEGRPILRKYGLLLPGEN